MALATACVAAQTPATGGAPAGAATPGSAAAGPGAAEEGNAIVSAASGANPETNRLGSENGGLTFLPELKPTDGVVSLAPEKSGSAQVAADASALREKAMLLDRAVAVINGEVILASDVREQRNFAAFEPYSVPGGEFTPMQAMQQIVNRTLLLDQMDEQRLAPPPTDDEVDRQIGELRKHIPACAGKNCETEAGWRSFLATRGFTEAGFHNRWKERMEILDFIKVRFRTGIRITKPEIESYYKQKLLPEFEKRKLKPPPLAQLSDRIDEVLLQQHVNVLLGDYLRSLKDAGNVQILDPLYNSLGNSTATNANNSGGTDYAQPARRAGSEQ